MKYLITLFLIVSSVSLLGTKDLTVGYDTVYICTGGYSTKYHLKPNCRGLSNCKGDIVRISRADARQKRRTLCGHED